MVREAVISSRIEGTQASLEDVLQYEADIDDLNENGGPEDKYNKDIHEIRNYRKAMSAAVVKLGERPLSINLIKDLHRILLSDVRGQNKDPGEIRRRQNWIVSPGTPIENATFVPPDPFIILDALSDWEAYIHKEEKDITVQLALIKAQFELIHPFLDGNGRIGRMLVPLVLYDKKMLSEPTFYISSYFEKNRDIYYDRLHAISQEHDWNGWISFFLQALIEQSSENSKKAKEIINLYNSMKDKISSIRNQYPIRALDAIFSKPIFSATYFGSRLGQSKMTANRVLRELTEEGIIIVISESSGSRPTIFAFPQLLNITEGVE
jgi:Fic family protein